MEALQMQHKADLTTYHTCYNANKALKNQLLTLVDDNYITAIKEEHIGYTNRSVGVILGHLYNTYGAISSTMLQKSAEHILTPYDPSAPMEHLFKRIDDAQDLATDARNLYQEAQLIGIAYDLIFCTA
eukprot:14523618-Ditylum_brightwellii.AAC.1